MRSDMGEVLREKMRIHTSRGKLKGQWKFAGRKAGIEDQPKHTAMNRNWQAAGLDHDFDISMVPLRRFLQSKLGKYWPKIYSEIKSTLNPSHDALDYLNWLVAVDDVTMDGKRPMSKRHEGEVFAPFFVHPKTQILHKNPSAWYWKKHTWGCRPETPKFIKKDDTHQYRLVGGVWYLLALKPIPAYAHNNEHVWVHDLYMSLREKKEDKEHYYRTLGTFKQEYGGVVYCYQLTQLGKREIKKILPEAIKLGIVPRPQSQLPSFV